MDWQPIETAPKDGENYLLVFDDGETEPFVDMCYFDGAWGVYKEPTWVFGSNCARPQRYYTHWMPVPKPPISKLTQ